VYDYRSPYACFGMRRSTLPRQRRAVHVGHRYIAAWRCRMGQMPGSAQQDLTCYDAHSHDFNDPQIHNFVGKFEFVYPPP
jgi:hypothetical protein